MRATIAADDPRRSHAGMAGRRRQLSASRMMAGSAQAERLSPRRWRGPKQGKRDSPECAGEDGGAVVQLLATDAHHQPDGDEGDENLQGDDGDLGGEGVDAEEEEDGGDEGGIAGAIKAVGPVGRRRRAEAVAVEERAGQQAHLVGMSEEPVMRTVVATLSRTRSGQAAPRQGRWRGTAARARDSREDPWRRFRGG